MKILVFRFLREAAHTLWGCAGLGSEPIEDLCGGGQEMRALLLVVIGCPPWSRRSTVESKGQILVLRFMGKLGRTMLGLLF